ncbi:MAG: peptidylprolyl isomerase [Verrucomicrobiota bacterium]
MKKMTNKLRGIALLTVVALSTYLIAATAPKKEDGLFANPVVAKGKGFEIHQNEVEDSFVDYKANMASRGQTIPEADRSLVESNLVQRLIVTKVLTGRANDADKAKAKESTEKLITDAKKQFPTEELFLQQLKATGMSADQFRARAYEQTLCEVVIEREVKSKIKISDEEAKKFYETNPARFERPESVRVAHVLISTVDKVTQKPISSEKKKEKEKIAKDVKARADKGEDFAKLAKEFSEDPGSKDKGGEYTFAKKEMVPEFETAAFSLKINQISDIVETRFGYHIIKLLQKIAPEKIAFDKVLLDLKEGLTQQELQKQVPDYFAKIKKEANVEVVSSAKAEKSSAQPGGVSEK